MSATTATGASRALDDGRLPEFETLRGLLALWVMLAHLDIWLGVGGLGRFLPPPEFAVDVFVILSGFVITKTLCDHPERSYRDYLGRRFRRIWPLFACTTLLMACLTLVDAADPSASAAVPTAINPINTEPNITGSTLPIYLLCHLALLHGMIPDSVVPGMPVALNGPGWSIGLEWQFYLIAPLLLAALRHGWHVALSLVFAAVIIFRWNYLPLDIVGSFLTSHIEFFVIGMVSYSLHRKMALKTGRMKLFGFGLGLALAIDPSLLHLLFKRELFTAGTSLPVLIWLVALLSSLGSPGTLWSALHQGSVARWLGSRSYGIYLNHLPALAVWRLCVPLGSIPPMVSLIAVSALALIASEATYRWIEMPFIRPRQRSCPPVSVTTQSAAT